MHSMNDPNQSYVGHSGPIALQGAFFPLQNPIISSQTGSRFYVIKVRAWEQHSSHSLKCGLLPNTNHPFRVWQLQLAPSRATSAAAGHTSNSSGTPLGSFHHLEQANHITGQEICKRYNLGKCSKGAADCFFAHKCCGHRLWRRPSLQGVPTLCQGL